VHVGPALNDIEWPSDENFARGCPYFYFDIFQTLFDMVLNGRQMKILRVVALTLAVVSLNPDRR